MREAYHEEKQRRSEDASKLRIVIFASLGLIVQPLIYLSFFFTYIEYGSPWAATSPRFYTGWQLLSDGFSPQTSQRMADMRGWYPPLVAPLALVLIVTVILPVLLYLAGLLLLMTPIKWKHSFLRGEMVLCSCLNLIGFLLSFFWLITSFGPGEVYSQSIEPAFCILPAGFLLLLLCGFLLSSSTPLSTLQGIRERSFMR